MEIAKLFVNVRMNKNQQPDRAVDKPLSERDGDAGDCALILCGSSKNSSTSGRRISRPSKFGRYLSNSENTRPSLTCKACDFAHTKLVHEWKPSPLLNGQYVPSEGSVPGLSTDLMGLVCIGLRH